MATGCEPRREEDLHRFIGPSLSSGFAELTGEPLDGPAVRACVLAYRERYAEVSVRETGVVPGIPAALTALGRGRRLGVATSKPRAFAEPLLEALALREHFEAVSAPDLAIRSSPRPSRSPRRCSDPLRRPWWATATSRWSPPASTACALSGCHGESGARPSSSTRAPTSSSRHRSDSLRRFERQRSATASR